jgi:glycosyltransferase involved in cell wall biosynthesis
MSADKLKVCLLTSSYPRSNSDTAGVFIRYLAETLTDRGVKVLVLAPADAKGATTTEQNVTVHRFQYLPVSLQRLAYGSGMPANLRLKPWLWLQVPFYFAAMTWSLSQTIRRERPDVIHAHWILPQGLIAVLARLLCRIPVITTAHGTDAFGLKNKFARRLKMFVLGKSDAWTANSAATAGAIEDEETLPPPRIIPMGIDVEFFARGGDSLRRELGENKFLVLFVGRLVENKGCRDLLRALSLLPPELGAMTMLWIVGDGYERANLQQYTKALAISDKVRFWGTIANHLLPDFYAAADLFVAPSFPTKAGDAEGQNVALLEAAAARVCALATRAGGIGEFVQDGVTGVLVDPGAPPELARAMEKLLSDAPLRARLAENALKEVTHRYEWRQIAAEFEHLYRQIVKRG